MKYHLRGCVLRCQPIIPKDAFEGNGSPLTAYLRPQATEFDPFGIPSFESRFALKFENGKLLGEAVPPGRYKLFVRPGFTTVSWMDWSGDLVIPDGIDPVDVGPIAMTNNVREIVEPER